MKNRLLWILAVVLVLGLGVVLGAGLVTFSPPTVIVQAAASLQGAVNRDAGLLIGAVQADSPAAKAGLVRGDIIVEANGKTLDSKSAPLDLLKDLKAGEKLTLKVLHGDEVRTMDITLADQNGKPFLGISPAFTGRFGLRGLLPQNGQKLILKAGARIQEVITGGPAEKAGLKVGDEILKVNDQAVDLTNDLAKVLSTLKPGADVKLNVQRKGEATAVDVQLTLGENPDKVGQAYLGIKYVMLPAFNGDKILPNPGNGQNLNPARPNLPNLPQIPWHAGLAVSEVKSGSPAEMAGLKAKDIITEINGKAAGTPEDFVNQIKAAKIGDKLTLTVLRTGEANSLKIEVTLGANPAQTDQAYLGASITSFMRNFQRGGNNNKPTVPPNPGGNF